MTVSQHYSAGLCYEAMAKQEGPVQRMRYRKVALSQFVLAARLKAEKDDLDIEDILQDLLTRFSAKEQAVRIVEAMRNV